MKKIADAGLLVAAADPHDRHHRWAAEALRMTELTVRGKVWIERIS